MEETSPESTTPRLTAMRVRTPVLDHEPGDTLHVAWGERQRFGGELRVPVFADDSTAEIGRVEAEALGPLGRGTAVVTARQLNVRSCPSTGCDVVDQLSDGTSVTVSGYEDGWYRLYDRDDSAEARFVSARYLVLPTVYRERVTASVRERTRVFYRQRLAHLHDPRRGSLISDWAVDRDRGVLRFRFYSSSIDGLGMVRVCRAMEVIANFVERTVADLPVEWAPSYSAGVYGIVLQTRRRSEMELAALTDNGSIVCRSP